MYLPCTITRLNGITRKYRRTCYEYRLLNSYCLLIHGEEWGRFELVTHSLDHFQSTMCFIPNCGKTDFNDENYATSKISRWAMRFTTVCLAIFLLLRSSINFWCLPSQREEQSSNSSSKFNRDLKKPSLESSNARPSIITNIIDNFICWHAFDIRTNSNLYAREFFFSILYFSLFYFSHSPLSAPLRLAK